MNIKLQSEVNANLENISVMASHFESEHPHLKPDSLEIKLFECDIVFGYETHLNYSVLFRATKPTSWRTLN